MNTNNYFKTYTTILDIKKPEWDSCNKKGNIFLSHSFLYLLESSGCLSEDTGWSPIYFALYNSNNLIACAPCYIKMHSQGEYVFDHAWANAYKSVGLNYYPKLLIASPFTPVSGMRILALEKEALTNKQLLLKEIKEYCKKNKYSGLHINFFDESELNFLKDNDFIIRVGEQFHFYNKGYSSFQNFLVDLSYKKRKNILKERNSILKSEIEIEVLRKKDIDYKVCQLMYEFYINTIQKKWSYDYLNIDFFLGLPKLIKENIIIIVAKKNNKIIASSLNFISNNMLFGRYWGATDKFSNLHFELCYYKPIEIAIDLGLDKVEAGAQGAHKIQRGYLPYETYSAHYLLNNDLHNAIKKYVSEEKKVVNQEINFIKEKLSPYKKQP